MQARVRHGWLRVPRAAAALLARQPRGVRAGALPVRRVGRRGGGARRHRDPRLARGSGGAPGWHGGLRRGVPRGRFHPPALLGDRRVHTTATTGTTSGHGGGAPPGWALPHARPISASSAPSRRDVAPRATFDPSWLRGECRVVDRVKYLVDGGNHQRPSSFGTFSSSRSISSRVSPRYASNRRSSRSTAPPCMTQARVRRSL